MSQILEFPATKELTIAIGIFTFYDSLQKQRLMKKFFQRWYYNLISPSPNNIVYVEIDSSTNSETRDLPSKQKEKLCLSNSIL